MKKILCIVKTAYRSSQQEEPGDAGPWLTHALRNARTEMGVLLQGSALNEALAGQTPKEASVDRPAGERPRFPDRDLEKMKAAGIPIHVIREDAEDRGVPMDRLMKEYQLIARADVPGLVSRYDQVWQW